MAEPARPRVSSGPRAEERAGELLARELHAAIAARGGARLAIPGGSAMAAAVVARELLGESWCQVALTFTDERRVAAAAEDSILGAARRGGLCAPAPAFLLPLHEDGESVAATLARVRAGWHGELLGALDFALIGMGADGHIASLFPGREWHGNVALHLSDSPKPPSERISLTRDALATARTTILCARGESKRDAVAKLLRGDPTLPAHGLPGLVIVTDLEFAP